MYPVMKIKKLFSDAKLPVRANSSDSGADVFAYKFEKLFSSSGLKTTQDEKSVVLNTNDRVLVHTGISATVDIGYEIQVRSRSGNALNKGLFVLNSPGTIDESYRGPICVIIANIGHEPQEIKLGDKIAQLVVMQVALSSVVEVEELSETSRGVGGFGSTGV